MPPFVVDKILYSFTHLSVYKTLADWHWVTPKNQRSQNTSGEIRGFDCCLRNCSKIQSYLQPCQTRHVSASANEKFREFRSFLQSCRSLYEVRTHVSLTTGDCFNNHRVVIWSGSRVCDIVRLSWASFVRLIVAFIYYKRQVAKVPPMSWCQSSDSNAYIQSWGTRTPWYPHGEARG